MRMGWILGRVARFWSAATKARRMSTIITQSALPSRALVLEPVAERRSCLTCICNLRLCVRRCELWLWPRTGTPGTNLPDVVHGDAREGHSEKRRETNGEGGFVEGIARVK